MKKTTEKIFIDSIDYMRAVAIFAVVAIHTSTRTFETSGFDAKNFTLSIFINQISRFAVPLFFAISGFTLEHNFHFHESYFSFFKKRLSKILIPYFFWSAVYYFFIFTEHKETFFESLAKGNASYQLYFIPSLVVLYMAFPLIHKYYNFLKQTWVFILIGLTEVILLYIDYYIAPLEYLYFFKIATLNILIFLLGMIAAHNRDNLIKLVHTFKFRIFTMTAVVGFYVFSEGSAKFIKNGNYLNIYSQWRPSVLIYTILIGLSLFYIFEHYISNNKFLKRASKYSFFIYFVHILVLVYAWKYIGQQFYKTPLFDVWFAFLVFGASYGVALLVRKIPKIRYLTG